MVPTSDDSLVLLACRVACGTSAVEAFEAALRRHGDIAAFAGALRRRRLAPLVFPLVERLADGEARRALRSLLEADYYGAVQRYLTLVTVLEEVLDRLASRGVRSAVLKGMALAERVYDHPALRPMEDLDVLVRRVDVPAVAAVLTDHGYAPSPTYERDLRGRQATVFVPDRRAAGSPLIDVHWDLVDAKSGPGAHAWSRRVWERLAEISVGAARGYALAPTDALVHAAVHLTVNHGLRGLLWTVDLAMMTRAWRDDIAWHALPDTAAESRLRGALYAALACCRATIGLDVPSEVLAQLRRRSPRATLLAWCLPRFAALGAIPFQEYVVPLLAMDRGRDVIRTILRRCVR